MENIQLAGFDLKLLVYFKSIHQIVGYQTEATLFAIHRFGILRKKRRANYDV